MKRIPFKLLFLFLIFSFFLSSLASAATKEDVLPLYEETMTSLERLGPGTDAFAKSSERLALVHEALASQDYDKAAVLLKNLSEELRNNQLSNQIDLDKEARLNWLELYFDLFQKFAFLALLAFLLMQNPIWRTALRTGSISQGAKIVWMLLSVFLSSGLWFFDLSRYGNSVWAIFDIQVVFAVLAGMMGGMVWGVLGGILIAVVRWFTMPGDLSAPVLICCATLLGAFFMHGIRNYTSVSRRGFFCGALVGLIHGLVIYLPAAETLPPGSLLISIGLVTFFEAAAIAVFFAVIAAVLQEDLKKNTENQLLKTQLLFLQAQLNPHFFFNALNSIAAICSREKAESARALVLKLGDFLRHSLKREGETVSLREEMDFINSYLEIEKARFQEGLSIEREFNVEETAWDTKIPIMVLQPLVENAIKHGIRKKESGGRLKITVSDQKGLLKIGIEDDGAGAEPGFFDRLLRGENVKIAGLGIGVRNIKQRLDRFFEGRAALCFVSAPGNGTKVTVTIPLEKQI